MKVLSTVVLVGSIGLAFPAPVSAGQLLLTNASDKPISCKVEGYEKVIVVPPAVTAQLHPTMGQSDPAINTVECGNLRARMMNITPTGPDGILVLNGQQTRSLNVLLYPYIPTLNGDFSALVKYIVYAYQAKNPQVMLHAVMNPSIDIYDFEMLEKLVGPDGYDVLELDMTFLGFLVTNKLIAPVNLPGDQPWPVAKATATWNGTVYGVPSWLCTNFIYYLNDDPEKRRPQAELRAQLLDGKRLLVSDFDGSWQLPSMYLNAYVQTYGYGSIKNAFSSPIDASVIQNLVEFATMCSGSDGNPCIDGRYHNAADGTVEKVFATGNALLDIGFSERSFFVNLYQTAPGFLMAEPVSWNSPYSSTLLMYTDAFVTNASTCGSGACSGDSQLFTTLMTSSRRAGVDSNNKLSILGFDACLMNMLEIAHHFRDQVKYLVGSQQTEPGDGWPYDEVLAAVKTANSADVLAKRIVEVYIKDYRARGVWNVTQSAIDVAKTEPAAKALGELGTELASKLPGLRTTLRDIRMTTQMFQMADYVDLIHLAESIVNGIPDTAIVNAAKSVIHTTQQCILASATFGGSVTQAHGLSVWFPSSESLYFNYRAKYLELKCSTQYPGWVKFLDSYYR